MAEENIVKSRTEKGCIFRSIDPVIVHQHSLVTMIQYQMVHAFPLLANGVAFGVSYQIVILYILAATVYDHTSLPSVLARCCQLQGKCFIPISQFGRRARYAEALPPIGSILDRKNYLHRSYEYLISLQPIDQPLYLLIGVGGKAPQPMIATIIAIEYLLHALFVMPLGCLSHPHSDAIIRR